MAVYEGKKLYLKSTSNSYVANLYTDLSDSYTGVGLPIKLWNGTQVYALGARVDDINSIPLYFQTSSNRTWKVANVATPTVQNTDYQSYLEISLSGNNTVTKTYNTIAFTVPYTTTVHLLSKADAAHQAWGVSDDGWQWLYLDLYLDNQTSYLKRTDIRKSYGSRQWRTLYDADIQLSAGTHTLKLNVTGKCSSKDSHLSQVWAWTNEITLK